MYVIDASVFVADARPAEPYHTDAHTLLTHVITKRQIVYVPTIVLAEVAAALARGTSQPDLAKRLVIGLQRLSVMRFVAVDSRLTGFPRPGLTGRASDPAHRRPGGESGRFH